MSTTHDPPRTPPGPRPRAVEPDREVPRRGGGRRAARPEGPVAPPACNDAIGVAPVPGPGPTTPGAGPMAAGGPPAGGSLPAWDFRPAPRDGGRDFGNANAWAFDPGLDALFREALQNALDAAASPEGRVEVVLRLVRLAGDAKCEFLRALAFDRLRRHLVAASGGGHKLGALLRDGLGGLARRDLLLLVIEDRRTVGLTGPERGPGHFAALCRDNLNSHKGATDGGAFGLGKATLWRALRLGVVLFHSHPPVPKAGRSGGRLLGRCELAWHRTDEGDFAGPGWFGRPAADGAESVWGDDALAEALYLGREGAGTSVGVVGFHDPAADRERPAEELAGELARAAAESFFPAMVAGRLAVRVELYDGRRPTWAADVDPAAYVPAYVRMLAAYRAGATAEQLGEDGSVAARAVELAVPERTADGPHGVLAHRAVLLVAADAGDDRGDGDRPGPPAHQLVAFRGPGMVVHRHSLQGICPGGRPVRALLLCGTSPRLLAGGGPAAEADLAAERFLRDAEPPEHDRWIGTRGLKAAYAHGCLGRLRQFLAAAADGVRAAVKPPSAGGDDGPRALRELLRLADGRPADEGPRVVEQSGAVDGAGRWAVSARIRLRPARTATRLVPAVYFVGEGGTRAAVEWAELESATPGCVAAGGGLLLPPGAREVRLRGVTDPLSHPIPAADSCVAVGVRGFGAIEEARS